MRTNFVFAPALAAAAALVISTSSFAQTASGAKEPAVNPLVSTLGNGVMKDMVDKIKGVKPLPVQGLSLIETTDGRVLLVSNNGRLAIVGGRWIDLFEGKQISNLDDAKSLDKMDLARMRIPVHEFSTFTVGEGKKKATIFLDPVDHRTPAVLRQAASLSSEYAFTFVLLPLAGSASGTAARRVHCAPRSLAVTALSSGKFESLPKDSPQCDVSPLQKAMVTAVILGIRQTPFLIRPDHTTTVVVKDLSDALNS